MPPLRQTAWPAWRGMGAVAYAHPPAHRQLFLQRRTEGPHRDIHRFMALQLRLSLSGVQGGRNVQQGKMVSVSTRVGS